MAANNGPFGVNPEDFDRFAREAGDGLRDVFGRVFAGQSGPAMFSTFFDTAATTRTKPRPETAGETGAGVWAVFVVDDGGARVEQVFASEIDALRANQHNTDASRRVRFLPYGIAVSALDPAATESGTAESGTAESGTGDSGTGPTDS